MKTQPLSSNSNIPFGIFDMEEVDVQKIVEIHNSLVIRYKCDKPQRGFFLHEMDMKDVIAQMNRPDRLFLVAKAQGQIAAYLIAKKEVDQLDRLQWLYPDARNWISDSKHWHVDQVATADKFARKGWARALYGELERRTRNGPLSCFIATHPYRNEASLKLHSRLGFQKVAEFESPLFLGIPNYKSVLLLKK
jgi:ribosomal protein S18 acetylase RimI-like enzyme